MSNDLRYPIGKFHLEGEITDSLRREFIRQIEDAPEQLRKAVENLNDDQFNTPYRAEGWTVRQVVHHLPDSHMNSYIRFKLALTEYSPRVKTYDEAEWAKLKDSSLTPVSVSLNLFEALHKRWAVLLKSLSASDLQRTFSHPEHGLISLDRTLALYAWHGRHHIAHITSLRERMGWK
jgi:uncharacterized damage-inducible protein DinB